MGEEVRPGRDGWGARYWLAGTIVAVVLVVLATAAILLVVLATAEVDTPTVAYHW